MKSVTHSDVLPRPTGIRVRPDRLRIPVRLAVRATTPSLALAQIERDRHQLQDAARGFDLEARSYAACTVKLAGKGLRGRGVRHDAVALLELVCPLPEDTDFFARVRLLETAREALTPLEDSDTITIGAARWSVSNPEALREALCASTLDRLAALKLGANALQTRSLELDVREVGPTEAYVQWDPAVSAA